MASYSYKQVTHRDDYLAAIALWQEQSGRESDEDPNYDGDCWLVTEFLLDQKDADLARVTAERDRLTLDLHSARQMVTDTHAALERSEAENARLRQERADALSVTSRDGLLSSEWVLRTGQAERRVAELEALLAQTDFILSVLNGDCDPGDYCPEAEIVAADAYARHRARQAHAALGAREPVEGRDFERMPGVAND